MTLSDAAGGGRAAALAQYRAWGRSPAATLHLVALSAGSIDVYSHDADNKGHSSLEMAASY